MSLYGVRHAGARVVDPSCEGGKELREGGYKEMEQAPAPLPSIRLMPTSLSGPPGSVPALFLLRRPRFPIRMSSDENGGGAVLSPMGPQWLALAGVELGEGASAVSVFPLEEQ